MIIVDRIIGNVAVCLDGDTKIDIPLAKISGEVKEGNVLNTEGGIYVVSAQETRKRRTELSERFNKIKAHNKE